MTAAWEGEGGRAGSSGNVEGQSPPPSVELHGQHTPGSVPGELSSAGSFPLIRLQQVPAV